MCLCSHKSHREMLLRLCHSSKTILLTVNYRKPPQYSFPTPQNDCYNIYIWLLDQGLSITIAGDSAGANLALHTTKQVRDNKLKLPNKLILISPWIDLCENKYTVNPSSSLIINSDFDFLPIEGIYTYASQCVKDNKLLNKEKINKVLFNYSPCNFDLYHFPPIYMFAGGREMLIDQQRKFVNKVTQSNIPIKYIEEPNMIHVYPLFAGLGILSSKNFFNHISDIFE